jgi:hypothetical protein
MWVANTNGGMLPVGTEVSLLTTDASGSITDYMGHDQQT